MARTSDVIERFPDAATLAAAAADAFLAAALSAVAATGRFTVALSGGATPTRLQALLATEPYASRVPWSAVQVFWGDERCVPADHAESNFGAARQVLLDRVPLPRANLHRIRGEDRPAMAAMRYEDELRRTFSTPSGAPRTILGARFDLVFLGLGIDGHTASLFPGLQAVREAAKWVVAEYVESVHLSRVTLTPVMFNAAAEVIFLVAGAEKREILSRVLGPVRDTNLLPAQAIAPIGGRLRWFADSAAAAGISSVAPGTD